MCDSAVGWLMGFNPFPTLWPMRPTPCGISRIIIGPSYLVPYLTSARDTALLTENVRERLHAQLIILFAHDTSQAQKGANQPCEQQLGVAGCTIHIAAERPLD